MGNHYIYSILYLLVSMKKGFTLIEIVIVLVVIGVLMAATMKFGSNRIVDLKAQSIKEQFVGYYNELYSQNMTSSFRDGKKYETVKVVLDTWIYYKIDDVAVPNVSLSDMEIRNLRFESEWNSFAMAELSLVPYKLWCDITDGTDSWNDLYFDLFIPENGKQYCFEITAETCKLIETKCD